MNYEHLVDMTTVKKRKKASSLSRISATKKGQSEKKKAYRSDSSEMNPSQERLNKLQQIVVKNRSW